MPEITEPEPWLGSPDCKVHTAPLVLTVTGPSSHYKGLGEGEARWGGGHTGCLGWFGGLEGPCLRISCARLSLQPQSGCRGSASCRPGLALWARQRVGRSAFGSLGQQFPSHIHTWMVRGGLSFHWSCWTGSHCSPPYAGFQGFLAGPQNSMRPHLCP